jgi:hypothetical protein
VGEARERAGKDRDEVGRVRGSPRNPNAVLVHANVGIGSTKVWGIAASSFPPLPSSLVTCRASSSGTVSGSLKHAKTRGWGKGLTGIVRSSSGVPPKDKRLLAARNMTSLCVLCVVLFGVRGRVSGVV